MANLIPIFEAKLYLISSVSWFSLLKINTDQEKHSQNNNNKQIDGLFHPMDRRISLGKPKLIKPPIIIFNCDAPGNITSKSYRFHVHIYVCRSK